MLLSTSLRNIPIFFLSTMYIYCAYSVMLKSPKQVSNSTDERRNKRSSWLFSRVSSITSTLYCCRF